VLKKGHEIIYDGISEEIEEPKSILFRKKSWKQIIVGKAVEMAIGGVVSETISKDLINLMGIAAVTESAANTRYKQFDEV
jgi:hypothetical protein